MKYLIYIRNTGLGDFLTGLAGAINFCIKYNYFLIIYSFLECLNFNFTDFFIINNFSNYSTDINIIPNNLKFYHLTIKDIINTKITYNKKTQKFFLDKFCISSIKPNLNLLVYSRYNHKLYPSLSLKQHYIDIITDIFNSFNLNNYITIHFRNTDIKNNINPFLQIIKNINHNTFYICSDDDSFFTILQNTFPHKLFFRNFIPPTTSHKGTHYINLDKHKMILDILTDLYFVLNSYIFIPSYNSSLSLFFIHQINNNNIFNIKSNTIIHNN